MSDPAILIVAGEKSGENYGAAVVLAFRSLYPKASFFGVGGTNMTAAGVEILVPMEDLAVMGLAEIVTEIPRIRKIFRRLSAEAKTRRPAAAVLIDSPDFNLRLAKRLRKIGVPVLYYISPTVWAWRKGRLRTIKAVVRKMLLIFPFEKEIYAKAGIPHRYVGHPLLERLRIRYSRADFFRKYKLDPALPLVTLMPGSRKNEIRRHIAVLREAAARLKSERRAQFVLIQTPDLDPSCMPQLVAGTKADLLLLREDAYEAIASSDIVLSACGTANLEAALLGVPLVAFYKISPLTYAVGHPFVRIRDYSIVNILAGRRIVPELIQKQLTADALVQETLRILDDVGARRDMKTAFARIRTDLGTERASENAARELAGLL
ncbi:MAG: lipid-A-disaccharide synthase [Candidatus Aminicenantes bacterium]|nr:lipid-A-disaccharide synthase [Candidatus Aminicenantes bacterium]